MVDKANRSKLASGLRLFFSSATTGPELIDTYAFPASRTHDVGLRRLAEKCVDGLLESEFIDPKEVIWAEVDAAISFLESDDELPPAFLLR